MSANCADCAVDTTPTHNGDPIPESWEYYMVHNHVWRQAGMGKGYLSSTPLAAHPTSTPR